MDIRNLGEFADIKAVWEQHPEGGREGDFLFIGGVKYRWNKYERIWENAATITETPARDTKTFDEDVVMSNNLTVAGVLRAKGVKQPNCGLFRDLASLKAAHPEPEVGMWAAVGNTTPAPIYRCDTKGVWIATGSTGGIDAAEVQEIKEIKDGLKEEEKARKKGDEDTNTLLAQEIQARKKGDEDNKELIDGIEQKIASPDGIAPLNEFSKVPEANIPTNTYEVRSFHGFQEAESPLPNSTISPVEVYFDRTQKRFYPKRDGKFFMNWDKGDLYQDREDVHPFFDKIYINVVENIPYRWNGSRLVSLSAAGKDGRLHRIEHGTSNTNFSLAPNVMHIWSVVPELRLTLSENPDPEFIAEYCFQFTSPADRGTAFLKPTELRWADDYAPPILPNKTYQGYIMENIILMVEVSV